MLTESMAIMVCPSCKKEVPNALFCLYCGNQLKGKPIVPRMTEMEKEILILLNKRGGPVSVSDVHTIVDGTKPSVRVMLSNLVKFGLVDRPRRGQYVISEIGQRALSGRIEVVVEGEKTPLIQHIKPQYLRPGTMIKLLKRAGDIRMSQDVPETLASILEQLGTEIAVEAVSIAKKANRGTVRLEDVNEAIRKVVG